ncbi:MAG: sialidase family protein, partial [Flammeovirgaceae bacterium]|nr:sialidase family protein [Flammeovirgaceae bacterium]
MFSRRYIMVAMATTLAFLLLFFNNRPAEEVLPAKKKVIRAKDDFKKDHPDLYHATMRMLKTKYGEEYPAYPRNYRHQELKKAEEQLQRLRFRTTSYQWDERGPSNVPGRTRGLVVDPRDPTQNTWLAGAVGGGVWKTTNGGLSWTHLTSNMPNLAIGSLAIAPSNPDVIYAGTGEAGIDGVGATGDGLYKSTDGGNTWVHLSSTSQFIDFENVSRIVVHPQNENILLVAVTADTQNYRTIGWQSAIYRSEDGGNSWIKTYESLGFSVEQLVAHPSDFNILYATVNRIGVLKSTDSGRTWRLCKKGMGQVSRVEIAISPTNPNVLYASCEGTLSGNNSDIYVSEDGGESWMLMIEEKKPDGSAGTNPDWLANQGWYNNTIMVHPFNDRAVYVGGVSLWFLERLQGQGTSINAVTGLSLIGTESFLFNEIRLFTDNGTNLQEGDFTAVEIRFGNGRKQKAHRFTVPAGSTSGVPANQYTYRDYVDVPFEVWDITNNR